ncbi:MAG: hypothetical protein Q9221_002126 [Calogaya cf. arnoldii]
MSTAMTPPPTPAEMLYMAQHSSDDRSSEVVTTAVALAIISTVAVALRFMARKHQKISLSWDDYLVLAALVGCTLRLSQWAFRFRTADTCEQIFALAVCTVEGYGARIGTGRHIWVVGPENTKKFLVLSYIFQLVYNCCAICVRASIMAFYLRVFPRHTTPAWWRACFLAISFIYLGGGIAGIAASIFICTPISYFWTRTGNGHCVNEMALYYSGGALTVIVDILVLALPMMIVWKLQMNRSKKIGVMGIFLLGGFVCLASIIRMVYIHQIVVNDPTWTQVNPSIWSTIEPCMGIVSACLPIIGPQLRKTKLLGSLTSSSWFSRSKRSGGHGASYEVASSERRNKNDNLGSLQKKKSAATATTYSTTTSPSYEDMALPLTEIEPHRGA